VPFSATDPPHHVAIGGIQIQQQRPGRLAKDLTRPVSQAGEAPNTQQKPARVAHLTVGVKCAAGVGLDAIDTADHNALVRGVELGAILGWRLRGRIIPKGRACDQMAGEEGVVVIDPVGA
jgi:hypothetical protein